MMVVMMIVTDGACYDDDSDDDYGCDGSLAPGRLLVEVVFSSFNCTRHV